MDISSTRKSMCNKRRKTEQLDVGVVGKRKSADTERGATLGSARGGPSLQYLRQCLIQRIPIGSKTLEKRRSRYQKSNAYSIYADILTIEPLSSRTSNEGNSRCDVLGKAKTAVGILFRDGINQLLSFTGTKQGRIDCSRRYGIDCNSTSAKIFR